LQGANASNRPVYPQQQIEPGAKHLRRRDVLDDGEHVEPMLGWARASHRQPERPADDGCADHRELQQGQLVGDAIVS
jgi:hypothetical protein